MLEALDSRRSGNDVSWRLLFSPEQPVHLRPQPLLRRLLRGARMPHQAHLVGRRLRKPPHAQVVTLAHIFRAVAPCVLMSLVLLAAVFWFPRIATWLPGLIG